MLVFKTELMFSAELRETKGIAKDAGAEGTDGGMSLPKSFNRLSPYIMS